MLGKNHSDETKSRLRETSLATEGWKKRAPMSQTHRLAQSLRSIALNQSGNGYSRTKKGWGEVGGQKFFYKSQWELNYANYLEFLKKAKHISGWEYEPETFWFEKIRRGVRSYTPDFRVTYPDGRVEYHEVKGWMDQKSKTKIDRMRIYHKNITLVLVDESQYRALKRQLPSIFG
jgi:predicted nuclease of restriction endonuclease-like RecB superfamily